MRLVVQVIGLDLFARLIKRRSMEQYVPEYQTFRFQVVG
jgi:hypothetical protein